MLKVQISKDSEDIIESFLGYDYSLIIDACCKFYNENYLITVDFDKQEELTKNNTSSSSFVCRVYKLNENKEVILSSSSHSSIEDAILKLGSN